MQKQRRFAVSDIHGANKALLQVLDRADFNKKEDILICLGDVSDGWSEVPECFETLLSIKNLIYVLGNHDEWLLIYFKFQDTPRIWTSQGGRATIDAYQRIYEEGGMEMMERHESLLENALPYYILDNKLFVHGGFAPNFPIENQAPYDLMWDRQMWVYAMMWHNDKNTKDKKMGSYDEIFIGHTSTSHYDPALKPVHACNVWNIDQGCGYEGKLTLINIDTKEYVQSDKVSKLYPYDKGR